MQETSGNEDSFHSLGDVYEEVEDQAEGICFTLFLFGIPADLFFQETRINLLSKKEYAKKRQ